MRQGILIVVSVILLGALVLTVTTPRPDGPVRFLRYEPGPHGRVEAHFIFEGALNARLIDRARIERKVGDTWTVETFYISPNVYPSFSDIMPIRDCPEPMRVVFKVVERTWRDRATDKWTEIRYGFRRKSYRGKQYWLTNALPIIPAQNPPPSPPLRASAPLR